MKLRSLSLFVMGLFILGACTRAVGLPSALPPTFTPSATLTQSEAQTPLVATITPLGAATQTSVPVTPTLAPTAWPLRLAVFFLWPGEVFNLRAEPGTATEILETLAADTRGLLPTGREQDADGVHWVEIQRSDGSGAGWVSAEYLTEDVPLEAFCVDARLGDLLDRFVLAVRGQDGVALVQLVSPAHGLLIQTNPANEPVHFVPFLFNQLDNPWLTQKWTRFICQNGYKNTVEGLVGNEDAGQMSAWYILSAAGIHPSCPGNTRQEITSPLFDRIEFKLDTKYYKGEKFTIIAHNNNPENIYIQKAKLNGKDYDNCFIDFSDISSGGTLELFMGKEPNTNWGKN